MNKDILVVGGSGFIGKGTAIVLRGIGSSVFMRGLRQAYPGRNCCHI